MNWLYVKKVVGGLALLGVIPFASAQSADQLIVKYQAFAGSLTNATNLVDGLRNGTHIVFEVQDNGGGPGPLLPVGSVALLQPPAPPQCTPLTGSMGFGNVDAALSLAKSVLAAIHIVENPNPSGQRRVGPADICAALNGGAVITPGGANINLTGILQLRADGLGWGEIAKDPRIKVTP